MSDRSKIEWTDATWSPTVGCDKVSPGCDHCYAIRQGARLQRHPAYEGTIENGEWTGRINLVNDRLLKPLHWQRPRRIFVDSMSDLFHPDVPDDFIASVFAVMGLADHHTFQVLTKRPQRMATLLASDEFRSEWFDRRTEFALTRHVQLMANRGEISLGLRYPLPNVWLGTSIESDTYSWRANHLRATPAAVRFLSLEPLLAPLPSLNLRDIGWVIVGGETGPGARPMHPDWARAIRDQCTTLGVPFLFKQWGSWAPDSELDLQSPGDYNRLTNEQMWFRDHPDDKDLMLWTWRGKTPFRTLDGRLWDEYPS